MEEEENRTSREESVMEKGVELTRRLVTGGKEHSSVYWKAASRILREIVAVGKQF